MAQIHHIHEVVVVVGSLHCHSVQKVVAVEKVHYQNFQEVGQEAA